MAFPYTARFFDFAAAPAKEPVTSDLLNAMQDACIGVHEQHDALDIWVDLFPGLGEAAAGDWLFKREGADPIDPTGCTPCLQSVGADKVLYAEISDWPEDSTLYSIEVDWKSAAISSRALRMYAARHVWPDASGSERVRQSLCVAANYITATTSRAFGVFTCDQNFNNWSHGSHKLVIGFYGSDTNPGDTIYGVRLNVGFYGTNKWATIAP